jgi:hypothetical protein
MLNRKIAIALTAGTVLAASGFSSSVFAATAATSANVDIVTAIGVLRVADPDFGVVIADPLGDTLVLESDTGNVVVSGASTHQTGTQVVGDFDVSGTANQAYAITDPGAITLDGVSGMDVTAWTVTNANGDCTDLAVASCVPALDGTGADTLSIGATLNIPAGQTEGQFSQAFNLEVLYQ